MKYIIIILILVYCSSANAACEILVVAVPVNGKRERGEPSSVRNSPVTTYGDQQGLPKYVKVKIIDATKEQVIHYLEPWNKTFVFDILQENAQGYRIRVKVDPVLVAVGGTNNEIRAEMKDYVVSNYGASVVSYSGTEAVLDVPKPVDLVEAKADIHDKFSVTFKRTHYYFEEADVAFAEANGGEVELTKAQVLNKIKNKLNE